MRTSETLLRRGFLPSSDVGFWPLSAYRQHKIQCNLTSANDTEAAARFIA